MYYICGKHVAEKGGVNNMLYTTEVYNAGRVERISYLLQWLFSVQFFAA